MNTISKNRLFWWTGIGLAIVISFVCTVHYASWLPGKEIGISIVIIIYVLGAIALTADPLESFSNYLHESDPIV